MKLILTGGGTGGHVTPALALIDEAKKEGYPMNAVYICRKGGDENRPIAALGIRQYEIDAEGLSRKISFDQLRALMKFFRAYKEAKKIIRLENPDAVFATGGYVSAPVLLAAKKCGIPYFLHESNGIAGLVTKMFAERASRVFLSTSSAAGRLNARRISTVGCPIRGEFGKIDRRQARKALGVSENEKLIVAFGGSLGAEKINEAVLGMAKSDKLGEDVKILLGAGRRYYADIEKELSREGLPKNIEVRPYIENMATVMTAADIAVCRCGAVTLEELKACRTPAILIPSPNVTDDHQTENAKVAVREGWAVLIKESALSADILAKQIEKLTEKAGVLSTMREAGKGSARLGAAKEILMQIRIDIAENA